MAATRSDSMYHRKSGQTLGMHHARLTGMHTIELPRSEWMERLNEFSRAHEGWPVSLYVLEDSIGAQPAFHLFSLAGVTADSRDTGTISITASTPNGGFFTHTVHSPLHVFVEQTDTGADAALEIESADGATAILQFRIGRRADGLVRGRCGER
jgi:hypothetical protein